MNIDGVPGGSILEGLDDWPATATRQHIRADPRASRQHHRPDGFAALELAQVEEAFIGRAANRPQGQQARSSNASSGR